MSDKIIRPERRRVEPRPGRLAALGQAVDEEIWSERRTHCWDLSPDCSEAQRKRCSAYFVRRNCWDLWAAEYFPPGRKPCCHPDQDCSECPVAAEKFRGPISIYVEVPRRAVERRAPDGARPAAYCPHLFRVKEAAGPRGDGEMRHVFKCHRRSGIALHSTYVSEVCGSLDHRECSFYPLDR